METKATRCRVCLNEEEIMINIFKKHDNLMISTKIMCLAKVRIYPGDGLPALICSICISKLNNCIEFIHLCELSDLKLRTTDTHNNEEGNTSEMENYINSDNEIKCSLKIENTDDSDAERLTNIMKEIVQDKSKIGSYNTSNQSKKNYKRKEIKIRQQCNICGRVMSSRHRLKTHLVTHTGERPFSCPFCNKNFSLEANLKVHLRVHTGEKPFRCAECGAKFAQSSGLIAHKRKHTGQLPYKCMLCPRSFRTIGHLQYHTKRHTGEKNFECEKCGRAFITRGDLNQHLATHTGDRSHVCNVCGLRLTRASNLKRHMHQLHSGTTTLSEVTGLDDAPNLDQRDLNMSTKGNS